MRSCAFVPKTKVTARRAIRKYAQFAPHSSTPSSSLRSVQVTTRWDPFFSVLYRLGPSFVPFSKAFRSASSPNYLLLLLLHTLRTYSKFVSATQAKERHADSSAHCIVNRVVRVMARIPARLCGPRRTSPIIPCLIVHLTSTTDHLLSVDIYTAHQSRSIADGPDCQHRSCIAVSIEEP